MRTLQVVGENTAHRHQLKKKLDVSPRNPRFIMERTRTDLLVFLYSPVRPDILFLAPRSTSHHQRNCSNMAKLKSRSGPPLTCTGVYSATDSKSRVTIEVAGNSRDVLYNLYTHSFIIIHHHSQKHQCPHPHVNNACLGNRGVRDTFPSRLTPLYFFCADFVRQKHVPRNMVHCPRSSVRSLLFEP